MHHGVKLNNFQDISSSDDITTTRIASLSNVILYPVHKGPTGHGNKTMFYMTSLPLFREKIHYNSSYCSLIVSAKIIDSSNIQGDPPGKIPNCMKVHVNNNEVKLII